MNFLDDSDTCYHYKTIPDKTKSEPSCISGNPEMLKEFFGIQLKCEPNETVEKDGVHYVYSGFDSKPMSLMLKIYFDKNGRKAIKSIHSDGTIHIRSETKDRVLEGKDQRESVTTKACAEATKKYIDNKERGLMNYYQKTFAGRR